MIVLPQRHSDGTHHLTVPLVIFKKKIFFLRQCLSVALDVLELVM